VTGFLNQIAIYLVYVGGGLGALAYCIAIWRKPRHGGDHTSASNPSAAPTS
jgi:hypothetical protein